MTDVANIYRIPRPSALLTDAGGYPSREWYNYWSQINVAADTPKGDVAGLAEALGSPDGTVASIPKTQVQGKNSIQQLSYFPHVTFQLVNDVASPGDVTYYGTNTTGNRGYFAVSDAFADSANIVKSVAGGITTFDLTDVSVSAGGTLQKLTFDAKGRLSAQSPADLGDLADVSITGTPTDTYVLAYNAGTGKWMPVAPSAGGGGGGDEFAVASGADTITATFSPVPTLADGLQFKVRAAAANATTTPTFNPNTLGALTITKLGGVALAAGDISGSGHELIIRYRASPARYELVNPASVQQPVGGLHIGVDNTDPRKPVISVTGLSAGAGYAEGTSFPASPGLGDKFYRNDLNLLCYYDGTRWLTVNEYQLAGIPADNTTGTSGTMRWAVRSDYQMYLLRWVICTYANASGGTTVSLVAQNAAATPTTLASFSTSGDTVNNFVNHDQVINSILPSGTKELKQGASGGGLFYQFASLTYRLVVT